MPIGREALPRDLPCYNLVIFSIISTKSISSIVFLPRVWYNGEKRGKGTSANEARTTGGSVETAEL